jgi:8-oxo-dGTP diphosphatase
MTRYVLGFVFDVESNRIVLIQKKRPTWQAGKWNGIGGHIEDGETSRDAMIREFQEETGVEIPKDLWQDICYLRGDDWSVVVYTAVSVDIEHCSTMTDEEVRVFPVAELPEVIDNLSWLIPLCLDAPDTYSVKVN